MWEKTLKVICLFSIGVLVALFSQFTSHNLLAVNYVETTIYNIGFSGGDIAVDASGNIFVADANNFQIRKYNNNGVSQAIFGGSGTGNGKFSDVLGIALDSNGDLFVVDTSRVQKFSNSGVYQSQFAVTGTPIGISLDSSDNIYVVRSSAGTSLVSKYTHAGSFITSYGSFGTGDTQLRYPSNIKVDSSGVMYISDDGNARVQVWDSSGAFLYSLTGFGTGIPGYYSPVDIDTNTSGDVFIADTYNNIIKIYDSTGVYLSSFDVDGSPFGLNVQSPVVLVTSAGDTSLRRFTLDDTAPIISMTPLAGDISNSGLPQFHGQVVDSMSPIYSVEQRIENEGFLQDWTNCTALDGEFNAASEDFTCIPTQSLPIGSYQISLRATDNVGNFDPGSSFFAYSFSVIDNAPAVITINPFSSNQTYDTTPTLTGSAIDEVSNIVSVEYEATTANPGVWSACVSQDGTFDERTEAFSCDIASVLELGSNTVTIRSIDSDGHINTAETLATYSFTVLALTTPSVTSGSAGSITATTATVTGNVSGNGGSVVTEKGIVYSSTSATPTTSDSKSMVAMGVGSISANLSGLTPTTLYNARAYAINAQGTSYGSVIQFTTLTPTPSPTPTATPTPTPTMPVSLQNVYVTFAKFKYNKYVSPAALKAGDTAYIKNFNASKLKLLQVFLYDYAKHGNQGYTKSKVTSTSMFLKTTTLLPTGKRYAYVFKFQDKATGIIATKYFVFYTTKTWLGHSVLGVKDINEPILAEGNTTIEQANEVNSLPPTSSVPTEFIPPITTTTDTSKSDKAVQNENVSSVLLTGIAILVAFGVGIVTVISRNKHE